MIRRCYSEEYEILTTIALSAKRYWRYPEHYYRVWHDELTITPGYLEEHETYCWDVSGRPIGFYSLTELAGPLHTGPAVLAAGLWLEHLFVLPHSIGQGIGTALFHHCISGRTFTLHKKLSILSDPHANGFYTRMGCHHIGDIPSTIPGRTTPLYRYTAAP